MSIGVIGRKVGMTQVFAEDGTMVPVSVLAVDSVGEPGVAPAADILSVAMGDAPDANRKPSSSLRTSGRLP